MLLRPRESGGLSQITASSSKGTEVHAVAGTGSRFFSYQKDSRTRPSTLSPACFKSA